MTEDETGAPSAQGTSDLVAVVDDDPTARRLMRFWLERTGYRVAEHDSARSVLESDGELPTVACVDLGLGEVTGHQSHSAFARAGRGVADHRRHCAA